MIHTMLPLASLDKGVVYQALLLLRCSTEMWASTTGHSKPAANGANKPMAVLVLVQIRHHTRANCMRNRSLVMLSRGLPMTFGMI